MSLAAHYLAALATPELGLTRLRRLVNACGSLEQVLMGGCHSDELPEPDVFRGILAGIEQVVASALPAARRAVAEAVALGLTVLCWEDDAYPAALAADESGCAPVLFIEGALPAQLLTPGGELAACAIVGTRRASSFALDFARDLGRAAGRHGVTVVSGLALGVDAAAHEGALEAGVPGATVAVLGGGHARLHPAANRGLAERIVRQGGAVISEWPPHVNPQPYHFLRRNRVIVGLSRVVAVVEAGVPSGALNTATHAANLGRQVLSVPSRPNEARNLGGLQLLREGAELLVEASDLLRHFSDLEPPQEPVHSGVETDAAGNTPALALEEILRRTLAQGASASLDKLARASGMQPPELMAALALLELDGRVSRTANGHFRWRS